ncbi:MAG: hypothetical protein EHM17_06485 [Verrucomicrobiaceae bacterium]|nr:MAG: hypothetical protein EHM17_06485 [Verrucomicrobiaceae bacterium]
MDIQGIPEGEAVFLPEHHMAPVLELTFSNPVKDLGPGCVLRDLSSANPSTVIRGCRIRKSCRIQSPVTIERCDVAALLMFYCDEVEGPMPRGSIVRDCLLPRGAVTTAPMPSPSTAGAVAALPLWSRLPASFRCTMRASSATRLTATSKRSR